MIATQVQFDILGESWTFQKMYGLRKVKLKITWPGRLEKRQI
jgi:hypothetical protein